MVYKLLYVNNRLIPHLGSLVTHEVNHGSCDVGKTEVAVISLDTVEVLCVGVVVNDAGNGVEGVAGFRLEVAVLVSLGLPRLLIHFVHLVSVAVVSGDQSHAAKLVNDLKDTSKLQVKCFHGATSRCQRTGMTNHVAVGEVDTILGVLDFAEKLLTVLSARHNMLVCFAIISVSDISFGEMQEKIRLDADALRAALDQLIAANVVIEKKSKHKSLGLTYEINDMYHTCLCIMIATLEMQRISLKGISCCMGFGDYPIKL